MANGYGGGSSSPTTTSTNAQGETAPAGFHYMPDGTLMSDAEHTRLYGQKIITSFMNHEYHKNMICVLWVCHKSSHSSSMKIQWHFQK